MTSRISFILFITLFICSCGTIKRDYTATPKAVEAHYVVQGVTWGEYSDTFSVTFSEDGTTCATIKTRHDKSVVGNVASGVIGGIVGVFSAGK